ncbi:alpha/beta hydrolase, partial [Streptomyces toxytricini]
MTLHHTPRRRTVRRLRAASAGMAAGLLVTGLLAAPAVQAQPGADATATPGAPIGTAARTVGDASYAPGACPKTPEPIEELEGARCGTLTVPENRARPDGRKIKLGVAIVPAVSATPKPDPIVWLA